MMQNCKILSLNLHCLVEENVQHKQQIIASNIASNSFDIICLQEVAQTQTKQLVFDNIKEDNYAYTLQQLLLQKGHRYYLVYLPIKQSFGIYDEGLAVLSKYPVELIDTPIISTITEYNNWKKRQALITKIPQYNIFIVTTHFGWSDEYERFESQVDKTIDAIPHNIHYILAGDFNVTPDSKEYQYLMNKGLYDTFKSHDEFNLPTHIDDMDIHKSSSRIDYIMSNQPVVTTHAQIHFSNNRVSDHYGISITLKL